MQKSSLKASILIWATFLSLIITVTFVSISTKINKNLKNNSSLLEKYDINNEIKNLINSWSLIDNEYILSNWDKIRFDKANSYIWSIKKWEIFISKIKNNSNLVINILDWTAPIKYKINSLSWVITGNTNINNTLSWDLIITSLWWYSKIRIESDINSNYLSKFRNYKILKQIWNKEIIQSKWQIKNF